MSLIRKHGAVLQAWACLDLVYIYCIHDFADKPRTCYILRQPCYGAQVTRE